MHTLSLLVNLCIIGGSAFPQAAALPREACPAWICRAHPAIWTRVSINALDSAAAMPILRLLNTLSSPGRTIR
jgi:hypothetical protein